MLALIAKRAIKNPVATRVADGVRVFVFFDAANSRDPNGSPG
jgi:hypothetical protein